MRKVNVQCEACDGEGVTVTTKSEWSGAQEQWYPHYEEDQCEECWGEGFVEVDDDEDDEDEEEDAA